MISFNAKGQMTVDMAQLRQRFEEILRTGEKFSPAVLNRNLRNPEGYEFDTMNASWAAFQMGYAAAAEDLKPRDSQGK